MEQIKARLNIVDVIGSYIELNKAGTSLKAKCPFHNEKTPSFFVSPDRGGYYCFGCGAKGDIFTFVEQFEGLDFKGALKVLADRAGVVLTFNKKDRSKKEDREILYEIMEETTKFFENNLNNLNNQNSKDGENNIIAGKSNNGGKDAYEYLIKRGLKPKTIKDFRLGFAKDEWNSLENFLRSRGYQNKYIELAGLIKKGEKGTYYDRFRDRIIFPIFDSSGRVIAFTGRILHGDEKVAKYLNSPETPLFVKANVLYGLDKAKQAIRQKGYSVLVEGQMDLIMAFQAGITNVIAGSGTALTDDVNVISGSKGMIRSSGGSVDETSKGVNAFGLVKRLSPNIMMVYDSDKAGEKAAERSAMIALDLGMDVKIANLPAGLDPADAILKDVEIFKGALKSAKHIVEFVLDIIMRDIGDERKRARLITERILPIISRINGHSEQANLIRLVKDKAGLDRVGMNEEALWEDLRNEIKKNKEKEKSKEINASKYTTNSDQNTVKNLVEKSRSGERRFVSSKRDAILRKVVGLIEWKKNDSSVVLDVYRTEIERITGFKYDELLESILKEESNIVFEAEQFFGHSLDMKIVFAENLKILEAEYLKALLTVKMGEIARAERNKDEKKATELLKDCQEITKKIDVLGK